MISVQTRLFARAKMLAVLAALSASCYSANAQGIHNPAAHYFSFSDSPFNSIDFSSGYFYLENFEDGLLNTPGVTSVGGIVLRRNDINSDSVDGDDGVIDNNGNTGGATTGAFYSNGLFSLRFNFNPSQLGGNLPTHAGVVITDCLVSSAITLTAFRSGFSLGSVSGFQSAEHMHFTQQDRFYGFVDLGGIDSIVITAATDNDWAMDHLQYGFIGVPSCLGDYNHDGGIDGSDVGAFFADWEAGNAAADVNADGGIDGGDVGTFFEHWEAGC